MVALLAGVLRRPGLGPVEREYTLTALMKLSARLSGVADKVQVPGLPINRCMTVDPSEWHISLHHDAVAKDNAACCRPDKHRVRVDAFVRAHPLIPIVA